MAASQVSTNVKIDDTEYSILAAPEESSAVVLAQKDKLNGSLDLKTLVDDLGRVGKFIRIAYNAIGAGGPKAELTKLQIEVQNLGYDITKLCDKSAITVAKFKSTSGTILEELKGAYQYLLDGLEDMAVDSLACLSDLAGKMALAAEELQKDFEEQEKKVRATLENTMKTQTDEANLAKEMEIREKELKEKEKNQKDMIEKYRKDQEEAKEERKKYEQLQDKEIANMKTGIMESVVNAVTSDLPLVRNLGTKLFGAGREDARKRADEWKEKAIRKLEDEKENRRLRYEGMEKMTEFLVEMEKCKDQQSESEKAVKFLHQACGALRQLSIVMMRAALFWTQLKQHCQELADDSMKKQIESGMEKYSEEKRKKVWTSQSFKVKAVTYYAKWVALYSMCNEYIGHIRLTQSELYTYIAENPTHEESRQRLDDLVKNFSADLSLAQEDIKKLDFKANEDIKQIEQSSIMEDDKEDN